MNYDGLYGINNMNKFLQSNNPNPSVRIGVQTYKVGDPVLFNESNRFAPLIYNNLKGKILAIEEKEDCVYFTIEIYLVVNELDVLGLDLVLLDSVAENTSVICFKVELQNDGDEDDDDLGSIVLITTLVPDAVKSFCPVTLANGQLNALGLVLSILMTLFMWVMEFG